MSTQLSAGSTQNLRKVNGGRAHFGVVHSEYLTVGQIGILTGDKNKYVNLYAMTLLY